MTHAKIHAKLTKIHFFCKFRTFPVTEGYAIWHSIFSPQPQQESSPTEQNLSTQEGTNFGHAMFLRYLKPEKRQPTQEGTNFGHAMFLRYLEPEKCQPTQEGTNFRHAMFLCYLESEKRQPTQEGMNFGHAMFLCYLEPAKHHKSTKKLTNFV